MTYGRLSDRDIIELCSGENPMIDPFVGVQKGNPSFGLSSAGVDFRLDYTFLRRRNDGDTLLLDPINGDNGSFWYEDHANEDGTIILRPLECILASTIERVSMPNDVQALVFGKSTYARSNLIANITPLEPGWKGQITLELHNCDKYSSVVLYAGQGIVQSVFDRIANPPLRGYNNREIAGKYNNQSGPTTSR